VSARRGAGVLLEFAYRKQSHTNIFGFSMHYSYAGLASFWIGREMNDKELIAKGTECKNEIEKLVVLASTWNFQNSECQNLDVLHSLSPG
jgi:hypothetical protein